MKKIRFSDVGFYFILSFMFIGATSPLLTYIALTIICLTAAIIGLQMTKTNSPHYCVGIINLLLYQNVTIGLGAHLFKNMSPSLKLITQAPFITLAIIWIIQVLSKKEFRQDKPFKFFIIFVICIFLSFIIGKGSALSILINIRNMTTFFMAYQIGRFNISSTQDFHYLVKNILINAIIFLIFGIILNCFGYEAYQKIGIDEIYYAKGNLIYGKLDDRFYTTLVRKQFFRMGSLMFEPVNLAYYFSIATILSNFTDWTKNKMLKFLTFIACGIGLILTFGKGGYLLTFTAFLSFYFQKIISSLPRLKKNSWKKNYQISLVLIIFFIICFCLYYYHNIGEAANVHFWAIQRTWKNILIQPYGYGLGTGGNMATLFNGSSRTTWLDTGGESALMSFIYQLGIQGIIALILCLMSMANINKDKKNKISIIFAYIPVIIIGIALMQDNTFTPQCIVPFMFVQGACYNSFLWKKEDET